MSEERAVEIVEAWIAAECAKHGHLPDHVVSILLFAGVEV